MVLVVNKGLKMGTGKMVAQGSHATLGLYNSVAKSAEGESALKTWEKHGCAKIVVKCDSTLELEKLHKQALNKGLYAYLVMDAGRTQIPQGSRTVLGVFGPEKMVDEVTGSLKLL
ncbi:peptidyl-tRNA hydrolase PTH2 domain-containing protein [Ditylenchus destructor]|uniref:peptidyl-tRNA hydrolase n=1 Tax=Ditylenchus destructor TaxID=166010 RepID=A0AAD4NGV2_9BILA|nr:peptidyl-tRNA hydrolase PTH2 domain-containing protein [Ditylenchus destructor]